MAAILTQPEKSSQTEAQTRKILHTAGTWFGFIFGLSFALQVWGWDVVKLSPSAATLAWAKLLIGLSISVILSTIIGRFVTRSSHTGVFVVAWVFIAWAFSFLAGHLPFDGGNLAVWVLEPRLKGEIIFTYDSSAAIRTTLSIIFCVVIGAFTGILESLAVQWSWDRSDSEGRMSLGSYLVLAVSVPAAIAMALVVDGLINQPLRKHQLTTKTLVETALHQELDLNDANFRTITPFVDSLSEPYKIHFVAFGGDERSWYSAYVDVVFADGFLLRCATSGSNVIYCDDFSQKFAGWMDELIAAGLGGDQPWLDAKVKRLIVDEPVLAWLLNHREMLEGDYQVTRTGTQSGWVFMAATFDSGFEMVCRFHDAAPIVVDQCLDANTISVR